MKSISALAAIMVLFFQGLCTRAGAQDVNKTQGTQVLRQSITVRSNGVTISHTETQSTVPGGSQVPTIIVNTTQPAPPAQVHVHLHVPAQGAPDLPALWGATAAVTGGGSLATAMFGRPVPVAVYHDAVAFSEMPGELKMAIQSAIKPGDQVEIHWRDADTERNLLIKDLKEGNLKAPEMVLQKGYANLTALEHGDDFTRFDLIKNIDTSKEGIEAVGEFMVKATQQNPKAELTFVGRSPAMTMATKAGTVGLAAAALVSSVIAIDDFIHGRASRSYSKNGIAEMSDKIVSQSVDSTAASKPNQAEHQPMLLPLSNLAVSSRK